MEEGVNVVETDLGIVRLSAKWDKWIESQMGDGLTKRKNTKAYKRAKRHEERLLIAVSVMAEMEWLNGDVLETL